MPVQLTFDLQVPYKSIPSLGLQPALDVRLTLGRLAVDTTGILDSGAMMTVFDEFIAQQLGIGAITDGDMAQGSTLGGPVSIYLFDVEMSVLLGNGLVSFPARVGFCSGYKRRNILGRNLVFSHFVVAISEARQTIYLRRER